MPKPAPLIVWFREDLRLSDNPALTYAAQTGRPVIALYIFDMTWGVRPPGAASRWWLNRSLASLERTIRREHSGNLLLRRGPALDILGRLAAETGATSICWNRLYDSGAIARDRAIKADLAAIGVESRSFNGSLLNEPWQVTKPEGGAYQVFTPYWRAAASNLDQVSPLARPSAINWWAGAATSERLAEWRLQPSSPDWSAGFAAWRPGEAGARDRMDEFLTDRVAHYAAKRDFPGAPGVSRLSPHLHFGEISPGQVLAAATVAEFADPAVSSGAQTFKKELGWREFNHHILFHHPDMPTHNFRAAFDRFPWRNDAAELEAWRRGLTGYPIVDAGMRELWSSGWMHNRVRMIVASFLTKHLLIDWRCGEAWFWDTLVDADIANNVANWQWVAGSGADAAPYFRIFNPVLQGAKYDPHGHYVRRWVPELASLPDLAIHRPWTADEAVLRGAGVTLGENYPLPIVDHNVARERALRAYRGLVDGATPGRRPAASLHS